MSNCLVTKLKGVVDNDNLVKLGEIEIKNVVDNSVAFRFSSKNSGNYARLKSGNNIPETGTPTVELSTSGGSPTSITVSPNDSVIISNKYDLLGAHLRLGGDIDIASLYSDEMMYLDLYIPRCNIADFNIPNVLAMTTYTSTHMVGTLSKFAEKFPRLMSIRMSGCIQLIGNIEDLGSLPSLHVIMLGDSQTIGGSIEAFVAARRSIGQTTSPETIICGYFNTNNITFNGEKITTSGDINLTWTANTITFGDVTINA